MQPQKIIGNFFFKAFKEANAFIKKHNEKYLNEGFLPGAVSLAAIIRKKDFFSYLGYGSLRKLNNDDCTLLTKSQTEKFRKYSKSFTRAFVRKGICNNPQHPLSYGVFTGEEDALNFLTYQETEVITGDELHFISDGLDCFYDLEKQCSYLSLSTEQILKVAEDIELQFKDSINSDDKTIIKVKILD